MASPDAERNLFRFAELRRVVGGRKAVKIAPLWAVAKRYKVIVRDLTDVSDLPVASPAFTCHGLDSTSPVELVAFDRRLSVAEIERRLEEGQTCEIWRRDDRIVHFRWLTPARTSLRFLGLDFEPAEGDCLLFEVFTLAHERVRGVHGNVASHSLRRASSQGFRRMVALCAWWNTPALRVGEKFGFECAGAVTRWQLGPGIVFTVRGGVELREKRLSVSGSRPDRRGSSRVGVE